MGEKRYDVIVAGAGPAGFCAAIAASRTGQRTLLLEASDSILGNITAGPLEAIMTFHDEQRQVIGGIPQELIGRCIEENGSVGHVPDTVGYAVSVTPFSPEICKVIGYKMLQEAGVELLLQIDIRECKCDGDTIDTLLVSSKNENLILHGSCFIDCTGDGDLAALAGCDFEFGDDKGLVQPMTGLVQVGGVDRTLLEDYVLKNPKEFKFFLEDGYKNLEKMLRKEQNHVLHLWGFEGLLREGYECGALSLKRQEMHMITGFQEGEVILNFTRVDGNPLCAADRSKAQIQAVIQGFELWKWLKVKHAAFRESWLIKTGRIGIREGRRIQGYHCISKSELENGGVKQHSVAMGAFPMDIHSAGGDSMEFYTVTRGYQIPMESLIAKGRDNLLLGGRCLCCTHEAQGSLRITATAMATGQAAGVCAGLAVKEGKKCVEIEYEHVRKCLLKQGALVK